jgi:hypothetical protein
MRPEAVDGAQVVHRSFVLNHLSEFFQLLSAPLARNHTVLGLEYPAAQARALALEVSWGLPRPEPDGSAVTVTLALPVFGDATGDLPRLLGAVASPPPPPRTRWTRRVPHPVLIGRAVCLVQVAVDLVFFAPGAAFSASLLADLFPIRTVEPDSVLFQSMAARPRPLPPPRRPRAASCAVRRAPRARGRARHRAARTRGAAEGHRAARTRGAAEGHRAARTRGAAEGHG